MTYGLSKSGFKPKRAETILKEMKIALTTLIPNINLADDSVASQMLGIPANQLGSLWDGLNSVYNSQYPNTSEGVSLDNVCELNAIVRLGASYSKVVIGAKGIDGVVVPYPFQVQNSSQTVTFTTTENFTITSSLTVQSTFFVSFVLDNTVYSLNIDTNTISINSGVGATAETIAEQLVDEINLLTDVIKISATLPDEEDGHFILESNDGKTGHIITCSANLNLTEFYTPFTAYATETGYFPASTGTLTYILTPMSGVDDVYNFEDAIPGNEIETDTELRIRRAQNIRVIGAATVDAIRARIIQEVDNVTTCYVFENDSDSTDTAGRPPHSIEVLVAGGDIADIANKIWETKGAGIKTYGQVSYQILDSMNHEHMIYFSRPTPKYVWLKITLTVNDAFPSDGETLITNRILLLAYQQFGIADDIITQKLLCPITSIDGVLHTVVEVAVTNDLIKPTDYTQDNIDIGEREYSAWDSSRIDYIYV